MKYVFSDSKTECRIKTCCAELTSTGHRSGGLAFKQVLVSGNCYGVFLKAAVELHVEAILILPLHGPTLPILSYSRPVLADCI